MTDTPVLAHLNTRQGFRFRPGLLCLAALLATVALYPPNARMLIQTTGGSDAVGAFMLGTVLAAALLGLAMALWCALRPRHRYFDKKVHVAAGIGYAASFAAFVWLAPARGVPEAAFALLGPCAASAWYPRCSPGSAATRATCAASWCTVRSCARWRTC